MRKIFVLMFIIAAFGGASMTAQAHEGHDDTSALEGAAGPAGAPLTLSAESIANIAIQTAAAELKPLPEILVMPGTVTLPPEKRAYITTRFNGIVREIRAKLGEEVRKGQELVIAEPALLLASNQFITLKSPIDGVVIQQNAVVGQPVSLETVLMEIADTKEVLMEGSIYETPDIARLQVGQKATADIGIYGGKTFEGVIEKIDAGPSAESRALHVYARFGNPRGELKPNLRGTLAVQLGGGEKPTVVVPMSAVLEINGVAFVFVREGNNFERREVQIGRHSGAETEIVSGVFPDEQVVTQGNYQLQYLKPEPKQTGK